MHHKISKQKAEKAWVNMNLREIYGSLKRD